MMRITEVSILNYRQYKDIKINFNKKPKKQDLHIIIGQNDTGKTNLLNAINWCLYGDEPHLVKEKEEMPLINTKVLADALDTGGKYDVIVELLAVTDNDHKLKFKRVYEFVIHDIERGK